QCSFQIGEKMPSSVTVGARPMSARIRAYSSGFRPCAAASSGVMSGSMFAGKRSPHGAVAIKTFLLPADRAQLEEPSVLNLRIIAIFFIIRSSLSVVLCEYYHQLRFVTNGGERVVQFYNRGSKTPFDCCRCQHWYGFSG